MSMMDVLQPIYTFSQQTEPVKSLCELGKPTKRGIKKCPKCGTFNGTRGMICKNKRCDAVLKDCTDKRKVSLDAVRLVGIVRKVYSVKVRDRGPDHRGFVQLPLNNCKTSIKRNDEENSINTSTENALCFVDSCQRSFDDSILKCHELTSENHQVDNGTSLSCPHIDSALRTQSAATPINFKQEILKNLKVSSEIKKELRILATEKEGALVQRVSRSVMAVKCQVSSKHPLGYLHLTFTCSKGREVYDKYHCSCTEFIGLGHRSTGAHNIRLKCVHYYACICALASDLKCAEEFAHFINYELPSKNRKVETIIHPKEDSAKKSTTKCKILEKSSYKRLKRIKKLIPKFLPVQIKILDQIDSIPPATSTSSSAPVWKFVDWLSYVTESINQTMQFENYGILNSLVFEIPVEFYEEFKKRMPRICRENPTFPNIYQVMNILDLKEMFDTSDFKLKISKRFVQDTNLNEYVEFNEHDDDNITNKSTFIYFLNVGQSTVDESDNTNNSFLIEWIPNFISKVGQLKFQYKYGRKST